MKSLKILALACMVFSSCTPTETSNPELIIKKRVDNQSTLAREPMVAQHPNGTLYITGYRNSSTNPQLWKSTDNGQTWEPVNVGSYEEGAQGNSDVDLFIDADGSIYLLSMTYTRLPADLEGFDFSTLKGEQITLGISRDEGVTWQWQHISQNDYDDRPWITSTSDGDLHIIWNDGLGVHHVRSNDRGETWEKQNDIYAKGGSSHMAAGRNGQLAVRVAPLSASGVKINSEVDLVQLSLDNGRSWNTVDLPGNRVWNQDFSGVPRWVEPLAWDQDDNLYTLWSEGTKLKLGITSDDGQTWQEYLVTQSEDTLYYPYMSMNDDLILATWISGFGENIRHNAAVLNLENQKLTTYHLEPLLPDIWTRWAVGPFERAVGGEYFPIIGLSNGNIGMVTTIQNSKDGRFGFTWWELALEE